MFKKIVIVINIILVMLFMTGCSEKIIARGRGFFTGEFFDQFTTNTNITTGATTSDDSGTTGTATKTPTTISPSTDETPSSNTTLNPSITSQAPTTSSPTTVITTGLSPSTEATTIKQSTTQEGYSNYYKEDLINLDYYQLSRSSQSWVWYYTKPTGDVKILVIPVIVSEYSINATESVRSDINKTFFGDYSNTTWESVASYYYKSSFEKLSFTGTVTNWLGTYTVEELWSDCNAVIEDTASFLVQEDIDPKDYDSDNDGFIDLIWYVYSAPNSQDEESLKDEENNNFWAYAFSTFERTGNVDVPTINNFCWASYDFMYKEGITGCPDAHTYIHETGHSLGLEDYYNSETAESTDPVGKIDMMSNNVIDHNTFSKMALGWVTPYVVNGNATITINPAESSGDCIVLGYNWDENAFSEYLVFELYTPTGLNEEDVAFSTCYRQAPAGYGVRVYHVDARLCYKNADDEYILIDNYSSFDEELGTLITVGHSNMPSYATVEGDEANIKLITLIDANGESHLTSDYTMTSNTGILYHNGSLFLSGDTFSLSDYITHFQSANGFNDGSLFDYTVSFDTVSKNKATITFTKNS